MVELQGDARTLTPGFCPGGYGELWVGLAEGTVVRVGVWYVIPGVTRVRSEGKARVWVVSGKLSCYSACLHSRRRAELLAPEGAVVPDTSPGLSGEALRPELPSSLYLRRPASCYLTFFLRVLMASNCSRSQSHRETQRGLPSRDTACAKTWQARVWGPMKPQF
jgi:hypothetical protein